MPIKLCKKVLTSVLLEMDFLALLYLSYEIYILAKRAIYDILFFGKLP
jgi:hypothetical protein